MLRAAQNLAKLLPTLCAASPRTISSAMMCDLLIAAYKDLQSREDTRNGAWQQEGWDEVVYYTGESFSKHKVVMKTPSCGTENFSKAFPSLFF